MNLYNIVNTMPPEKIHVGARIPKTLFDICSQRYESMTDAITAGLELLAKQIENECPTTGNSCTTNENECPTTENKCTTTENSLLLQELKIKLEEREKNIETLKTELEKAPTPLELADMRARSEELEKYNQALKEELEKQLGEKEKELEFLKGQITIKDQQIDKQAFSLQSVIQENSRLNLKLLPESQETKNTQEQKLTRWQYLKGFVFGSK